MIIDFNKYGQGGGSGSGSTDLTNYWTSGETVDYVSESLEPYYTSGQTEEAIAAATSGITVDLSGYYTSGQTENAITSKGYVTSADVETQIEAYNYTTSAETEQQIFDATPSIVMDTRRKVVFPLNDYASYAEYAFFDSYEEASGDVPVAYVGLYDNQGNMIVMPDDNVNEAGEIDITGKTITFTDIAAGSYKMAFYKQLNENSEYYEETFPVYLNSSNADEGEQIFIHSTEDEEIQPLLYAYNTRWGNEVFITKGVDDNDLDWNFPKDVEELVIDLLDGVDIQITYKPTAEELVGADLIDFEGTVQQAFESAGIYNDEDGVLNVPQMIADGIAASGGTVDLSGYYTSGQTDAAIAAATQDLVTSGDVQTQIEAYNYITSADTTNFVSKTELLEKEEVISTALNELNDTKVASTTIKNIVQISQADYDLLDPPVATTFYIITGTTS